MATFRRLYSNLTEGHVLWNNVPGLGKAYSWPKSTIAEPPFFQEFSPSRRHPAGIRDARALAMFGDS